MYYYYKRLIKRWKSFKRYQRTRKLTIQKIVPLKIEKEKPFEPIGKLEKARKSERVEKISTNIALSIKVNNSLSISEYYKQKKEFPISIDEYHKDKNESQYDWMNYIDL